MKEIGVAVIGTGFMGRVHVEALRRVGVSVIGICGSSPARSRAAAERWELEQAYGRFSEVLRDDRVHSVHIGTPNRMHFEMSRQALLAGKHVMCEKPLAMTSAESGELVRIAAEHPGLAAAVNYNIRFYPLCLEAGARVREGRIGTVVHVTGSYVQDWLVRATDFNWRVLAEENGALRAVADIGTHWLDLVYAITRLEVEAVCADLKTVHPVRRKPRGAVETFQSGDSPPSDSDPVEITTDDYGAVLLRFRGGARGCLHVSQVTPGRKNCLRLEIAASEQTLAWNSEQPNQMWIGHRDRPSESMLRDPALLTSASRVAADYPGGHNEGYADSFKQCFRAFYEGIAGGGGTAGTMVPTFSDGHREVVLCEAILKSHLEQRWVRPEEWEDVP